MVIISSLKNKSKMKPIQTNNKQTKETPLWCKLSQNTKDLQ